MRSYGQYCGLARAAETLGERWAMLIVRDLMIGPQGFDELRERIGIPEPDLTARLRDLEEGDVIAARSIHAPGGGTIYALTEYGEDLGPALAALGRWGGRRLDVPRPGEVITDSSLVSALRAGFRAGAPRRSAWNIAVAEARAWAVIEPGEMLRSGVGTADATSVVWMTWEDAPSLRRLMAGSLTGHTALETGRVVVDGARDPEAALAAFERSFHLPLDAC